MCIGGFGKGRTQQAEVRDWRALQSRDRMYTFECSAWHSSAPGVPSSPAPALNSLTFPVVVSSSVLDSENLAAPGANSSQVPVSSAVYLCRTRTTLLTSGGQGRGSCPRGQGDDRQVTVDPLPKTGFRALDFQNGFLRELSPASGLLLVRTYTNRNRHMLKYLCIPVIHGNM